jgi:Fe2+ or Zn2+ uptake regulation protein
MDHWILEQLKAKGYKNTDIRARVSAFIEEHEGIFSAHQIVTKFQDMDKVSIYRTIELLAELDLIHPITSIEGVQYYEMHGNTHHHHIICTRCHRSACVDCDVPKVSVPGFSDPHHTFLLTGICDQCR